MSSITNNIDLPQDIDANLPILLVDNQDDLRLIIAHQLSLLKFKNILQARDSLLGYQMLQDYKNVSLVICSLELPDINGLEFLDEIREETSVNRPPFCLTMYNANKDKIMLAVEKGVDEILVKPFPLSDIMVKAQQAFFTFNNPRNPDQLYELAKRHLRSNELEMAERIYTNLADLSKSARPWVGLAKVAKLRAQKHHALDLLMQAERNNPHYVHLYSERANLQLDAGEPEKALASYKQAIDISPLNPIRYIKCAEILNQYKQFEAVVELLELAVAKDVSAPDIFHHLSQACYYLKEYKKAIRYIKRALSRDNQNSLYLNQLALSYKATGDMEEANKVYNQAIKLDSENFQAQYNKAIMLIEQKKQKEAIKILRRLVKKFPKFKQAKDKLTALTK
ncbi:MAG: tetratricopeptide repeat protein [Deltaproteobacteria bacterium]|nr:tetratricopeptide repeat protein [Deltaproteobacteria bacterium]